MPVGEPRGSGDRRDADEGREGCFRPEPALVRPVDQDLSGSDRTDAEQVEELGRQLSDQGEDFVLEVFGLGLQGGDRGDEQGRVGRRMIGTGLLTLPVARQISDGEPKLASQAADRRRRSGGHIIGDEAQPRQGRQLHSAEHVLGPTELPRKRLVRRGGGEVPDQLVLADCRERPLVRRRRQASSRSASPSAATPSAMAPGGVAA